MTNAEAWFNIALRARKPAEGSLGRTAQDGHLDSHTAPERLTVAMTDEFIYTSVVFTRMPGGSYCRRFRSVLLHVFLDGL